MNFYILVLIIAGTLNGAGVFDKSLAIVEDALREYAPTFYVNYFGDYINERELIRASEKTQVNFLLKYQQKIKNKKPLLHIAVENNHPKTAKFLLEHGADINQEHHNKTPLEVAFENKRRYLAALILSKKPSFIPLLSTERFGKMIAAKYKPQEQRFIFDCLVTKHDLANYISRDDILNDKGALSIYSQAHPKLLNAITRYVLDRNWYLWELTDFFKIPGTLPYALQFLTKEEQYRKKLLTYHERYPIQFTSADLAQFVTAQNAFAVDLLLSSKLAIPQEVINESTRLAAQLKNKEIFSLLLPRSTVVFDRIEDSAIKEIYDTHAAKITNSREKVKTLYDEFLIKWQSYSQLKKNALTCPQKKSKAAQALLKISRLESHLQQAQEYLIKKNKKFDEYIERHQSCVICQDEYASKKFVIGCMNNHSTCLACFNNVHLDTCPTCRGSFAFDKLTFCQRCKNSSDSCKFVYCSSCKNIVTVCSGCIEFPCCYKNIEWGSAWQTLNSLKIRQEYDAYDKKFSENVMKKVSDLVVAQAAKSTNFMKNYHQNRAILNVKLIEKETSIENYEKRLKSLKDDIEWYRVYRSISTWEINKAIDEHNSLYPKYKQEIDEHNTIVDQAKRLDRSLEELFLQQAQERENLQAALEAEANRLRDFFERSLN